LWHLEQIESVVESLFRLRAKVVKVVMLLPRTRGMAGNPLN